MNGTCNCVLKLGLGWYLRWSGTARAWVLMYQDPENRGAEDDVTLVAAHQPLQQMACDALRAHFGLAELPLVWVARTSPKELRAHVARMSAAA